MKVISDRKASPSFRRTGTAAFTLLEIMLVVAIIALLLGAAMFGMRGNLGVAKETVSQADINAFTVQLNTYQIRAGRYPTTEQGLKALVEEPKNEPRPKRWSKLMDKIKQDPWNNDYVYVCPGKHNTDGFDLSSKGPDGAENTPDDIANWEVSSK